MASQEATQEEGPMAGDGPPKKKSRMVTESAESAAVEIMKKELQTPVLISYRESLQGARNTEQLSKYGSLIQSIPDVALKTLVEWLITVAKDKEDQWHLAADVDSWALQTAKRLKAMKRDVAQAVVKAKERPGKCRPPWLQPFLDSEGIANLCDAEVAFVMANEQREVAQAVCDIEASQKVATEQPEVAKAVCDTEPAQKVATEQQEEGTSVSYRFGWDSELQVVIVFIVNNLNVT